MKFVCWVSEWERGDQFLPTVEINFLSRNSWPKPRIDFLKIIDREKKKMMGEKCKGKEKILSQWLDNFFFSSIFKLRFPRIQVSVCVRALTLYTSSWNNIWVNIFFFLSFLFPLQTENKSNKMSRRFFFLPHCTSITCTSLTLFAEKKDKLSHS